MIQQKKLGSVCDIQNGYAFKSADYKKKGIPLLRISNFNDGEVYIDDKQIYVDEEYLKTKNDFIVSKGDILIALSGATTGKYGVYNFDFPSLLNQRIGVIKSGKSNFLLSRYFLYYLTILKKDILRQAGGAAQPNISTSKIAEFKIPLPPLEAQKSIAEILDNASALRDKTKQLLEEYDQLAQSIFLEMFGDPVTNSKGWEVKNLKDLTTKILSGNTPKGGSNVYVPKGITFFRSQNVWRNRIELKDAVFIDSDTHSKMKNSSLKYKDILMTKTGRINTENSSLGRAAIYLGQDDDANINGHVYLIRPKKDVIPEFVLFILTSLQYRDYIRRVCVGGIDKRQINKNHLQEFPIIYPPKKLQVRFINKLALIENQKELAKQELKESEDLFQALLQKAFNGDLVKEKELEVN